MKLNSKLKKARNFLVIIFCLFFLTGCSTKLAYNFLDWAMLWYAESYVNLNKEQEKFAKNALEEFHQWHRKTQLPLYADYIEQLQERLQKTSSADSIHAETDQAQIFIDSSFNQLIPALAELCKMLTPKQIVEIEQNLIKDEKKYRKKYIEADVEKKYKLRADELKDYLSPFFGRFTKEQREWIESWSQSLEPYEELTLKQQEIWRGTFSKAMSARGDDKKLESYLRELVLYETDNWQPELQERLDKNQALTYALIARLMNNRSPKQLEKMEQRLNKYKSDFRELAVE